MSTMTLIADNARVLVPGRVLDPMTRAEFREWAGNDDLPEKCVVYYHRGEWGVDVSKEQIFTHSDVKRNSPPFCVRSSTDTIWDVTSPTACCS